MRFKESYPATDERNVPYCKTAAAVITAGRDGYGECRLQSSGVLCQRKDVPRITTLPERDFLGLI